MNGRTLIICLAVASVIAACGDDETPSRTPQPVDAPDNPEREREVLGPPDDEHEAPPPQPEHVPRDPSLGEDGVACCPTVFAYAPRNPQQVVAVVLAGTRAPLDTQEGLTLTQSEGVWSAEACIPPDYPGTYHYAVDLRTAGDEPFHTVAYNPYAPTAVAAGEVVNAWIPATDCAAVDVEVHAKTSE